MICSYDYKCPHCDVIWNTDSNNSPPQVGDIEICPSCHKAGKITYAKIVFESEKVFPSNSEPKGVKTNSD